MNRHRKTANTSHATRLLPLQDSRQRHTRAKAEVRAEVQKCDDRESFARMD